MSMKFRSYIAAIVIWCWPSTLLAGMSVTHEALFEAGRMPNPTAFIKTHDNGFLIVGTTDNNNNPIELQGPATKAMAIKTDSKGKVIWRYVVSDAVDVNGDKIKFARTNPIYSSAVEMPDESVYICGTVPSGERTFGQLTHLDKNGNLLDKQSIIPEGFHSSGFDSCIAWGKGFAAVGYVFKPIKTKIDATLAYDKSFSNMIVYLNQEGRQIWLKTPPLVTFVPPYSYDLNPLQITSDGGIVFARRSDARRTQIVHVKLDGQISTQRISGRFMLALPTNGEKDVELISADSYPLTKVTLDDNLQEISRTVGKTWFEPFTQNMVYRLPDESLVLFGFMFGAGKYPKEQSAAIMKVDPSLQNASTLSVSPAQDSAFLNFALALPNLGEFVCVRSIYSTGHREDIMNLVQSQAFKDLSETKKLKILQGMDTEGIKHSGFALNFVTTQ